MRYALARWLLALVLRLDPEHPLTVLQQAVRVDKSRGMGGVWHVTITMPTFEAAGRLTAWTMFAMQGKY